MVNDVARGDIGFDAGDNEVWLVARDGGERHVAKAAKGEVARVILDEVVRVRESHGAARQPA